MTEQQDSTPADIEEPDQRANDQPLSVDALLTMFSFQAVMFTMVGVAIWVVSGRLASEFVVVDLGDILLGIALGLALAALAWGTYKLFPRFSENMARLQSKNFEFLARPFPFYGIILLSICAGVGEEALFRGGLQTLFSDYVGVHLAILVSSTLFALIHLTKPTVSLLIFGIGVLFGYIYWLTGSLLLVMIGHTVYDIFAIAALKKQFVSLGLFDTTKPDADDADLPVGE